MAPVRPKIAEIERSLWRRRKTSRGCIPPPAAGPPQSFPRPPFYFWQTFLQGSRWQKNSGDAEKLECISVCLLLLFLTVHPADVQGERGAEEPQDGVLASLKTRGEAKHKQTTARAKRPADTPLLLVIKKNPTDNNNNDDDDNDDDDASASP